MLDQDKVLNFLKVNGPVLPSKVAKNIKTDILLASALLSHLASRGKIKISKMKIGGSPLYYLPGQEAELYNFAAGNINPKDHQVLDKLKVNKILREKDLDLLNKVALRSLRDFAVPLHVSVNGQKELFWKWHLLSDEETNNIIRSMLFPKKEEPGNGFEEQKIPSVQKVLVSENEKNTEISPEVEIEKETLKSPVEKMELKEESAKIKEKELEEKLEKETKIEKEELENRNELKETKLENDSKNKYGDVSKSKKSKISQESKSNSKTKRKKKTVLPDDFAIVLEKYLNEKEMSIEEKEIIRKNSEIDLLIKVPSVVGEVTYFCKAKNKIRCDEKDISSAYMEAQIKKLPLLFLYKKEITKKAKEMLESGAFQNVILKKFA